MVLAVHELWLLRPPTIVMMSRREEKAVVTILSLEELLLGIPRQIKRHFYADTTGAPLVWIW